MDLSLNPVERVRCCWYEGCAHAHRPAIKTRHSRASASDVKLFVHLHCPTAPPACCMRSAVLKYADVQSITLITLHCLVRAVLGCFAVLQYTACGCGACRLRMFCCWQLSSGTHASSFLACRSEDATYAWKKLDGISVDGRKWKIDYAVKVRGPLHAPDPSACLQQNDIIAGHFLSA